MKTKRILLVLITVLLVMPANRGLAATNHATNEGNITTKDEVVYASLKAAGTLNEIYVVNILEVTTPGSIIDYGPYTTVKNLTDLSDIEQSEDKVELHVSSGTFYYQGNMKDQKLPWDIDISYRLDGEKVAPESLAGKDGRLLLTIKTSANETVDPVFYENYVLQIMMTLDTEVASHIQAPDATIINVGRKRQIAFNVMPESDGEFSLLADVVDFEMEGIDISAIPLSMAIDAPEIDEMTKDMRTLSDAIAEMNDGVSELNKGVSDLNQGVHRLREGSSKYEAGMSEVKHSSSELIQASETIEESLTALEKALSGSSAEMDLSELAQLPEGLSQLADGLREVADGLSQLKVNYAKAYAALDEAMDEIPNHQITETEVQQLYKSDANRQTVDQLLEVYVAAQTVKGTYDAVKEAFAAVEATLEQTSSSVHDMSNHLASLASELSASLETMEGLDSLSELQEGVAQLAANYGEFHGGLILYTDGISQLADSYSEIHSGLDGIAEGTSHLETGVDELHKGTKELANETNDLPEQMQEEIDAMIDDYDKSDFEAVSFVSAKNENIHSVQFILKTEPIEVEEGETTVEEEEEKPGFWQRLKHLFS
ncbi:YhgE/Pip domain-containing protein [Halalkalibacterium halodurans]|uniref:BH0721 protein n=1 Tax=Halalkalibacterium halodurans (strain ATCC BAA-125 / DSM 18197 / FERM 7344 / JCM 9153 / C-125) TaxID=272558 RepID=Q9KEX8_HALH5|nr:YhgE/Pip domain-containing protein [Halalkalibacterium halodurans]MED4080347.1 YhgE/Pip domain-containing protein [Halalkalibacterium halodurans]MED4084589.1 YhgE/Pip domain-containing protein [Halalkalibacterium halodurans]MED4104847.1 YhgE/Pip domain-containing protein [Halalkalibacterium halodurans]MED4109712.1 YhgE/Pip domain-containing protein [Halalkalibacterium halodurans]MED4122948.1 YhgE/Pip domain-containing protein [Halalkalibacterium halodurans]